MTTDNPTVGQAEAEGAANANSPVSSQVSPPIEGEVTKLLTEYGGRLESLTKELRGLQSRQDKGEKNQASFQEQLARYQQLTDRGLKPDEALAEMQRVDSFASWQQDISKQIADLAARLGGIGNTPNEQQMMTEVLSEFKLDPKDPYVASQLAGRQFASRVEAEAFAGKLLRDKVNSNQPNPAQAASTPSSAPSSPDLDALAIEYEQLSRNPSANIERMREIRKVLDGIK